jgi:hypothetical protein
MLGPDLLDRRALAWLRPVDVYGRPVSSLMRIVGRRVTAIRKKDGTIAVLAADGFDDYTASFLAPTSPAVGSKHIALDIDSASGEVAARRYDLTLPRDPDPAKADKPGSLFQSVAVEMLPGAGARLTGSACALRVTVRRKSDKKLVENALVRAQTEDGQFSARGLTDSRGEAVLIFPSLPIAFPGAGANLRPDIQARVVVTADTGSARFSSPNGSVQGRPEPPFVDPDELGSTAADFSTGTEVTIGAGLNVPLTLDWKQP